MHSQQKKNMFKQIFLSKLIYEDIKVCHITIENVINYEKTYNLDMPSISHIFQLPYIAQKWFFARHEHTDLNFQINQKWIF